jgi:mRNA-degrading endonuclease YafQ of YafQ-DinJ toxin-antitoxin module
MLKLVRKSRFKKDFKKLQSAGKDLLKLAEIISRLARKEDLPAHHHDHRL